MNYEVLLAFACNKPFAKFYEKARFEKTNNEKNGSGYIGRLNHFEHRAWIAKMIGLSDVKVATN